MQPYPIRLILNFIFFFLLGITGLFSCKAGQQEAGKEYFIHLTKNGGMVPVYDDIYISTKESYYKGKKKSENGYTDFIRSFNTSNKELDKLIKQAGDLGFFNMTYQTKERVYDRGGIKIEIGNTDKTYNVSNQGRDFIDEKFARDFHALAQSITDFAAAK